MIDTENEENVKKMFDMYEAEAIYFYKHGNKDGALRCYNTALELRPGDKKCLVARSQCYLQLGEPEKALADADETLKEDKSYIKGLLQKAEALYLKGDFEFALVFFHRGHKLRPEVQGFRLGIQKCQDAIENCIGEMSNIKLEVKGDLSFLSEDQQKGKSKTKRGGHKSLAKKDEKRERHPHTVRDAKTCKQLLGELFADKDYLEKFLKEMEHSTRKTEPLKVCENLVFDCLDYLDSRTEFWRQQKPTYSRQRDKKMRDDARLKSKDDPTAWVLKQLEEIDEAQMQGEFERSLKQGQRVLKVVTSWSEDDFANREEVIANLHSLIGNAHLELGNYGKALDHHQRDLNISEESGSDDGKSRALDNLGRVHARMGKFDRAIEVWEEKLPMSNSVLESTWLYHEIGRCYLELNQFDAAREYGEKSNAEAEIADDNTWKLNSCVLVGQALVRQEEYTAALEWFQKSLEVAKALEDRPTQTAIQKAMDDVNKRITKSVRDRQQRDGMSPRLKPSPRRFEATEQESGAKPGAVEPAAVADKQERDADEETESVSDLGGEDDLEQLSKEHSDEDDDEIGEVGRVVEGGTMDEEDIADETEEDIGETDEGETDEIEEEPEEFSDVEETNKATMESEQPTPKKGVRFSDDDEEDEEPPIEEIKPFTDEQTEVEPKATEPFVSQDGEPQTPVPAALDLISPTTEFVHKHVFEAVDNEMITPPAETTAGQPEERLDMAESSVADGLLAHSGSSIAGGKTVDDEARENVLSPSTRLVEKQVYEAIHLETSDELSSRPSTGIETEIQQTSSRQQSGTEQQELISNQPFTSGEVTDDQAQHANTLTEQPSLVSNKSDHPPDSYGKADVESAHSRKPLEEDRVQSSQSHDEDKSHASHTNETSPSAAMESEHSESPLPTSSDYVTPSTATDDEAADSPEPADDRSEEHLSTADKSATQLSVAAVDKAVKSAVDDHIESSLFTADPADSAVSADRGELVEEQAESASLLDERSAVGEGPAMASLEKTELQEDDKSLNINEKEEKPDSVLDKEKSATGSKVELPLPTEEESLRADEAKSLADNEAESSLPSKTLLAGEKSVSCTHATDTVHSPLPADDKSQGADEDRSKSPRPIDDDSFVFGEQSKSSIHDDDKTESSLPIVKSESAVAIDKENVELIEHSKDKLDTPTTEPLAASKEIVELESLVFDEPAAFNTNPALSQVSISEKIETPVLTSDRLETPSFSTNKPETPVPSMDKPETPVPSMEKAQLSKPSHEISESVSSEVVSAKSVEGRVVSPSHVTADDEGEASVVDVDKVEDTESAITDAEKVKLPLLQSKSESEIPSIAAVDEEVSTSQVQAAELVEASPSNAVVDRSGSRQKFDDIQTEASRPALSVDEVSLAEPTSLSPTVQLNAGSGAEGIEQLQVVVVSKDLSAVEQRDKASAVGSPVLAGSSPETNQLSVGISIQPASSHKFDTEEITVLPPSVVASLQKLDEMSVADEAEEHQQPAVEKMDEPQQLASDVAESSAEDSVHSPASAPAIADAILLPAIGAVDYADDLHLAQVDTPTTVEDSSAATALPALENIPDVVPNAHQLSPEQQVNDRQDLSRESSKVTSLPPIETDAAAIVADEESHAVNKLDLGTMSVSENVESSSALPSIDPTVVAGMVETAVSLQVASAEQSKTSADQMASSRSNTDVQESESRVSEKSAVSKEDVSKGESASEQSNSRDGKKEEEGGSSVQEDSGKHETDNSETSGDDASSIKSGEQQ